MPATEATWEDKHQIGTSFPTFNMNLEDKVLCEDESVDRIQEEEKDEVEVAPRKLRKTRKPNSKYL